MSNKMSLKGTSLRYSKNGKTGITNLTINAEKANHVFKKYRLCTCASVFISKISLTSEILVARMMTFAF